MQPLERMSAEAGRGIRVVLTDIDDTITTAGRLDAQAYTALERLQRAGIAVVPVTGRPAGWCDHIARMWPVDAVVGENGAFYFRYDHAARRMHRHFFHAPAERAAHRERLRSLAARIVEAVPGAAVATDQAYREADLAIDWCEDVAALDAAAVGRIVALFEEAGAVARVSSIHVNGWFGAYDKLAMTRRLAARLWDDDLDRCGDRYLFVGDSPNDEPMFEHFPLSVGVANVRDFESRMRALPAFVTAARGGAGFAQAAERVLAARREA